MDKSGNSASVLLFIPSVYTAAFAGVKYIFTQIGAGEQIELNFVCNGSCCSLCIYDIVWQIFLWICVCIWNFGRCSICFVQIYLQEVKKKRFRFLMKWQDGLTS